MKEEMFNTLKEIYPICRSITGDGVRETLKIFNDIVDINVLEIPSGTKVFDWVIPQEWNISGAYIERMNGERIIDFKNHNLHVMSYSEPIDRVVGRVELMEHLHYMSDDPDHIPYVTSYYNRNWGFCIKYKDLDMFEDDEYRVKIDSSFKNGSLTIGEIILPGKSDKEILLSTNICHPSMANNEASGPALLIHLAKYIRDKMKDREYTYRILFLPETIGSVAYLSFNIDKLKRDVFCGYTIVCVGGSKNSMFGYVKNINSDSFVNRLTEHVMSHMEKGSPHKYAYTIYPFTERGSDERQYCFPGVDLDIGSIIRSKYGVYKCYHTSGDDLNFVSEQTLYESFIVYVACINAIEDVKTYTCTTLCEPNMGKRGLYPITGDRKNIDEVKAIRNVMVYSNGERDTLEIAEILDIPIWEVVSMANVLLEHGLIEEVYNEKNSIFYR